MPRKQYSGCALAPSSSLHQGPVPFCAGDTKGHACSTHVHMQILLKLCREQKSLCQGQLFFAYLLCTSVWSVCMSVCIHVQMERFFPTHRCWGLNPGHQAGTPPNGAILPYSHNTLPRSPWARLLL